MTRRLALIVAGLFAGTLGLVATGVTGQVLQTTLEDPTPAAGNRFGFPLAMGDVNFDGMADIAVGVPGANGGLGRVSVLSVDDSPLLTLNSPTTQVEADFAMTLAMGDTDGDGSADIAVGAQREDVGADLDVGRVYLFSSVSGTLIRTLDTPNPGAAVNFGFAIAMGDVNGDGRADIAAGAPYERFGAVYLFDGVTGALLRSIEAPDMSAAAFGFALSMADANGDGSADLAVGAPGWPFGLAGRAYLFDGPTGSLLRTYDSPFAPFAGSFGWAVAIGDADADGRGDVGVGEPHVGRRGTAYVFSGQTGNELLRVSTTDLEARAIGSSVAMGDVTGDGKSDLIAGAPQSNVESDGFLNGAQGRVYVVSSGELADALDTPNAQVGARFGEWVAVGDADGNGQMEVLVGSPFEDVGTSEDQGRAYVFCIPACRAAPTPSPDAEPTSQPSPASPPIPAPTATAAPVAVAPASLPQTGGGPATGNGSPIVLFISLGVNGVIGIIGLLAPRLVVSAIGGNVRGRRRRS